MTTHILILSRIDRTHLLPRGMSTFLLTVQDSFRHGTYRTNLIQAEVLSGYIKNLNERERNILFIEGEYGLADGPLLAKLDELSDQTLQIRLKKNGFIPESIQHLQSAVQSTPTSKKLKIVFFIDNPSVPLASTLTQIGATLVYRALHNTEVENIPAYKTMLENHIKSLQ